MEFKSAGDFFEFISGPGAVLVIMLVISYFLAGWEKWNALASRVKQLIIIVASILLAFVGMLLASWYQAQPEPVQAQLNQVFLMIYGIGAYVLVPQSFHALVNKKLQETVPPVVKTTPATAEEVREATHSEPELSPR